MSGPHVHECAQCQQDRIEALLTKVVDSLSAVSDSADAVAAAADALAETRGRTFDTYATSHSSNSPIYYSGYNRFDR